MKITKRKKNIGIVILFLAIALALGYYIGQSNSSSDPSYIKSGVTTLVFTMPPSTSNPLQDCKDTSKVFINNIFPICTIQTTNCISCSFSPSKYFTGEIDCVCIIK